MVPDSEKGFNKVADGKRRAGRGEKLGGTLGYLDLEMQVSTIQIYVRRLKLRMEQTEKESHERLRMYPVIGALAVF